MACRNCGAAVDKKSGTCWKCGVRVATGREPAAPTRPRPVDKPKTVLQAPGVPSASLQGGTNKAGRRSSRKSRGSRRSLIATLLLLAGVALLVISLVVGWYSVSATASSEESGHAFTVGATETYYPLNQFSETFTCQGSSDCPQIATTTWTPYAQGSLDSLGTLYDLVTGFIVASILLGLGATLLFFLHARERSRWGQLLVVVAALLALLAPVVLFAAQPAVLSSQGSSSGGSSPSSSFFGSCTGSACGTSLPFHAAISGSWGPSTGWYLSLAAIVLLLAGL